MRRLMRNWLGYAHLMRVDAVRARIVSRNTLTRPGERQAGDQHRPSASSTSDNASAGPEILLASGGGLGVSRSSPALNQLGFFTPALFRLLNFELHNCSAPQTHPNQQPVPPGHRDPMRRMTQTRSAQRRRQHWTELDQPPARPPEQEQAKRQGVDTESTMS